MQSPSFIPKLPLPSVRLLFTQPDSSLPTKIEPQCDCDCACVTGAAVDLGNLKLATPASYYLELTPACPNRCSLCGNVFIDRRSPGRVEPPLGLEGWQKILAHILPTASLLKLTGGEPTRFAHFYPLLDMIDSAGVAYVLLTSGRWRAPRCLLARLEKSANFQGFLISLHGPDAPAHESLTNARGSFAEALASIQLAARRGMNVSVNTVLTQTNLGRLAETVHCALDAGAGGVVFSRYIGASLPGVSLSTAGLRQAVQEISALERDGIPVKFGNCLPQCFEQSSSSGCTAGETFCTVSPWGDVRPCNHASLVAGNLLEQEIAEIWWSPAMESWRKGYAPACESCAAFAVCRGGCKALSHERRGDPLMAGALREYQPQVAPRELELAAYAIPIRNCRITHEAFGPALLGGGRVLPLSPELLAFFERIEGQYTLLQIEAEFGEEALAVVGSWYQAGLIEFHIIQSPSTLNQ